MNESLNVTSHVILW